MGAPPTRTTASGCDPAPGDLLAPVPLCSTHIAMSVLRMEPLWMTTGQIAGLAAVVAKEKGLHVAQIDPQPLPGMLNIQVEP